MFSRIRNVLFNKFVTNKILLKVIELFRLSALELTILKWLLLFVL